MQLKRKINGAYLSIEPAEIQHSATVHQKYKE